MGSQDLKPDGQKPRSVLVVGMAVSLVIAGSMLFAGTMQLRSMRAEFMEMDAMLSMLKRQTMELQKEKETVGEKHAGEVRSLESRLAEKEKDIEVSVELMGEKKAKLKEMESTLADKRMELEEKDQLLASRQAQVETNKNAAKKLALVLAQTQADKERLKTETAALIKPEIDKCNEAMAAKDAAISALVGEREKTDSDIVRSDREVAKVKGELNAVQQQLDKKNAELEQLKAWKGEAKKELDQQAERSKKIWAASITSREAAATKRISLESTPAAFPPSAIKGAHGLGEHLQSITRAAGVELGGIGRGSVSNLTAPLLGAWTYATQYSVINIHHAEQLEESFEQLEASVKEIDPRIGFTRAASLEAALNELDEDSLDFIHIGEYKETREENQALLAACWSKLKEGGALAGGFSDPMQRDPEMRAAVVAFAEEKLRQPLFGIDRRTPALWLLRK